MPEVGSCRRLPWQRGRCARLPRMYASMDTPARIHWRLRVLSIARFDTRCRHVTSVGISGGGWRLSDMAVKQIGSAVAVAHLVNRRHWSSMTNTASMVDNIAAGDHTARRCWHLPWRRRQLWRLAVQLTTNRGSCVRLHRLTGTATVKNFFRLTPQVGRIRLRGMRTLADLTQAESWRHVDRKT